MASARTERSFIMVKPDGVQRGLVGKIIERFEQKGYKMVAGKLMIARCVRVRVWVGRVGGDGGARARSPELIAAHYADLSTKGFYAGLCRYIVRAQPRPRARAVVVTCVHSPACVQPCAPPPPQGSGPVFAMVWEGAGVVAGGRKLLGATKPADSAPGTIRGDFAIDVGRCAAVGLRVRRRACVYCGCVCMCVCYVCVCVCARARAS
jgi:nucleoside-diphosphate kinase